MSGTIDIDNMEFYIGDPEGHRTKLRYVEKDNTLLYYVEYSDCWMPADDHWRDVYLEMIAERILLGE